MVEILLFVISIPVLVPALLLTWIQSRRWGRVPMTFIFIDGAILFLIGLGSDARGSSGKFLGMSAFTWLMFLGLGAAVILTVLRSGEGKLDQGILMGWSNLVVLLLMIGGASFLWGFLRLTWTSADPAGGPAIPSEATALSADQALKLHGSGLHHVRLKNALLDEDRKVWRVESGIGGFLLQSPQQPLTALSMEMLRAELADRLGTYVLLVAPTKEAMLEWIPSSPKDSKGGGRSLATLALPPSDNLLLVSRKLTAPPESKCFDPDSNYGVLARIDAPPSEGGNRVAGTKMLALQVGPAPDPATASLCLPVSGSGHLLWVSTLRPAPRPAGDLQGILETLPAEQSAALSKHIRKAIDPGFAGAPKLLLLASLDEYRRIRELEPARPPASQTSSFAWLGIGGLLLGCASVLALKEA
jgi:hypothetical protein